MSFEGETWRVVCKGALVGEIVIESSDFPWLHGRFVAGPAFPDVKDLFDRELALLESIDEDYDAWEAVYEQIAQSLQLIAPRGPVGEFLLHIQDDSAWFRWSDEPFEIE